jgi:tetratricopeptide (TPR) repeat protein
MQAVSMKSKILIAGVMISGWLPGAQQEIQTDAAEVRERGSIGMPLQGKVSGVDALELALLRIQVLDIQQRRLIQDQQLGIKGDFTIPSLPTGFYEVRVVGQAGEIKYSREMHTSSISFLAIQLPKSAGMGQRGTVSAVRLMHETPKAARKEIDLAAKALKKQDRAGAIEHLQKAAQADAENFEVASNLGALYLQNREPDKAIVWLEKAFQIDPNDAGNLVGLSAYHATLGNFANAEKYARASLNSDPNYVRARYMLGVALVRQGKNLSDALGHLEAIQNTFVPARSFLKSLKP